MDLINVFKYIKCVCAHKDGAAMLFSMVPNARTKGNGHNLQHKRFYLNIKKHFFIVQVTEHRLSGEIVVSPSLKTFKKTSGHGSGQPTQTVPGLNRGVAPDDLFI